MKFNRIALISTFAFAATLGSAFSASDVTYWVGSGSNEAVFVLDYNDGNSPHSYAWGYRWNGTATGADMLAAIDAADSGLDNTVYNFSFGPYFDSSTYDANHDGTVDHVGSSSNGFWAYFTKDAEGDAWVGSMVGMSGRTLVDGSWDGWSFSTDMVNWTSTAPTEPVAASQAVPEPLSMFGLGIGALGLISRKRRK